MINTVSFQTGEETRVDGGLEEVMLADTTNDIVLLFGNKKERMMYSAPSWNPNAKPHSLLVTYLMIQERILVDLADPCFVVGLSPRIWIRLFL